MVVTVGLDYGELENRKQLASGVVCVRELVSVGDARHGSQTDVGRWFWIGWFDKENERHGSSPSASPCHDTHHIFSVRNDLLALQHNPLAGQPTQHVEMRGTVPCRLWRRGTLGDSWVSYYRPRWVDFG